MGMDVIEALKAGDPLLATYLNELSSRINAFNAMWGLDGGIGIGGMSTRPKARTALRDSSVGIVMVTAFDSVDEPVLSAFYPAGIESVRVSDTTNVDSAHRALEVRTTKPRHWGNWVIPLVDIAPGTFGPAVISGNALVRLNRLHDAEFMDRADLWRVTGDLDDTQISAGPPALLRTDTALKSSNTGMGRILWFDTTATPTTGEQWAVVRLEHAPTHRQYTNTHSTTIRHGDPVNYDPDDVDGMLTTANKLALQSPKDLDSDEAASDLTWINCGGDVTTGADGICVPGAAIANVDASVNADDEMGSDQGTQTLVTGSDGYRVEAYLATIDGVLRAAVRPFHKSRIFVSDVNSLRDDSAGSNFGASGAMKDDEASAIEWWALLKLKKAPLKIDSHMVALTVRAIMDTIIVDGDAIGLHIMDLDVSLVVEDWDPTTVTYTTGSALATRQLVTHPDDFTGEQAGSLQNNTGGDVTTRMGDSGETDRLTHDYGDSGNSAFILSAADVAAGKRIFGLLVQFDPLMGYGDYLATATVDTGTNANWIRR